MTLGELKELVAKEPRENDGLSVEVWLPGSTIRLSATGFIKRSRGPYHGKLLIEGNVNPGSALCG